MDYIRIYAALHLFEQLTTERLPTYS